MHRPSHVRIPGSHVRSKILLCAVLCVTTTTCSSSTAVEPDDPVPVEPGPPTSLVIVSGDGQLGVVGSELTNALTVRITDAAGRAVSGRAITFAVVSGGGSLFVTTSSTNAEGEAANRWTLGPSTSVAQAVEARIVVPETGAGHIVTFHATALPGPAASLVIEAGDQQEGKPATALTDSLAVLVRDQGLNPVPGATVTWQVTSGEGVPSPTTSTTGPDGIARTRWTLGPLEGTEQALEATLEGVGSVEFRATFPPPLIDIFSEDFENGLGAWLGRASGHHAEIATDPLDSQNSAVRFWRTVAAGDIFSQPLDVDQSATYTLEFDYLGVYSPAWNAEKGGGYIGIADAVGGLHAWIAGSSLGEAPIVLTSDGSWHHYRIPFIPSNYFHSSDGRIHIMLEDGEGSVAPRDAYFDNIRLYPGT